MDNNYSNNNKNNRLPKFLKLNFLVIQVFKMLHIQIIKVMDKHQCHKIFNKKIHQHNFIIQLIILYLQ